MIPDRRQLGYLSLMGIEAWALRGLAAPGAGQDAVRSIPEASGLPDWSALQARVSTCTRCALHEGRHSTVFGSGDPAADWMFIGEAPGAEEDRQGLPFVGRAGQLLTAMLQAVGLDREQVYIANILKCRPPGNRDPRPEEVSACAAYLDAQIQHVRPRLIVALGRIAAQNLLGVDTPIGRLRGKVHEYGEHRLPLIVTYHPAYLLRSPQEKRKVWQDLCMAASIATDGVSS